MKTIAALLLIAAIPQLASAKAYFARQNEMIQKADIIAVVQITDISDLHDATPFPYYSVTGTVQRALKGTSEQSISFHVPTFFPCAETKVSKGEYLVFLANDNGVLQGCNWYYSYRQINDNQIEWFAETNSLTVSIQQAKEVLVLIEKEIGNPQPAASPYVLLEAVKTSGEP